jgi:hypothetical protein
MSGIPIVQGVAVSPMDAKYSHGGAYYQGTASSSYHHEYNPVVSSPAVIDHGAASPFTSFGSGGFRNQPTKKYQDVIWSIVFYLHLIVMIVMLGFNISTVESLQGGSYGAIMFLVLVTSAVAVGLSSFALQWMMTNTITFVQTALIFSVGSSLAIGIFGLMTGNILIGILGLLSFAVGICYSYVGTFNLWIFCCFGLYRYRMFCAYQICTFGFSLVWPRIPFAASNLVTALTAVRENMGLAMVAYGFLALAFGWSILWCLGVGNALEGNQLMIVFLCFLSFYWVHQVLQNTVHVTVTGVIGTWWFVPSEASSGAGFCSPALTDSFYRATTYSFGSICFGSFLVAVVQALRALEHHTRNNDDCNILSCIIQCILSCIQGIIEVCLCMFFSATQTFSIGLPVLLYYIRLYSLSWDYYSTSISGRMCMLACTAFPTLMLDETSCSCLNTRYVGEGGSVVVLLKTFCLLIALTSSDYFSIVAILPGLVSSHYG